MPESTALHDAARGGNPEAVKLLLDGGADVNAKNIYGETPLHTAVLSNGGTPEVVKLLLDKGADVNTKDKYGDTLLHTAIDEGTPEVVKLLLDKGADLNARDKDGNTPLQMVAHAINVDPECESLVEAAMKERGNEPNFRGRVTASKESDPNILSDPDETGGNPRWNLRGRLAPILIDLGCPPEKLKFMTDSIFAGVSNLMSEEADKEFREFLQQKGEREFRELTPKGVSGGRDR